MKKNKLVIHIGTNKTGTTALHNFLRRNDEQLQKYGWHVFSEELLCAGENKPSNWSFIHTILREEGIHSERWQQIWYMILECLKVKNVIVISQSLYGDKVLLDLLEFIKESQWDNVNVVVYLRRQDTYLESVWNQMVKGRYYNTDSKRFLEIRRRNEKEKYERLNYYTHLEKISKIIGRENVIVRVYEKQQFAGERKDILSDFFDVIGIKPDWENFREPVDSNDRLSGSVLEMKRILNPILKDYFGEDGLRKFKSLFAIPVVSSNEGYFSIEERIDILKDFEDQNELVAREYLHREDGVLFYDMDVDIPQCVSETTKFQTEAFQMLGKAVLDIYRKSEQQANTVARDILQMKAGNRKIVFWGAGGKGNELALANVLPVELVVDNDVKKAGTYLHGIRVCHSTAIRNWDDYFVVITCVETAEIERQLQGLGLTLDKDFVLAKKYYSLYY